MLLTNGADPNLKVFNEINDRNSQLRPVLVEYLASNEHPSITVVNLLIRYGAKVYYCCYVCTKKFYGKSLMQKLLCKKKKKMFM